MEHPEHEGREHDDDREEGLKHHSKFSLGESTAADAYGSLITGRQAVIDMSRKMAELTVPSVFPPDGYLPGEDMPGNNQSIGAQCVNNLASRLMFMATPPGLPIADLAPNIQRYQAEITKDPALYAGIKQALSQREASTRERLQASFFGSAYTEFMKLLLISGNGLFKWVDLDSPTVHRADSYVVSRDSNGHPLVTILKETVAVASLDDDVAEQVYRCEPELEKIENEWDRKADIYTVCKLEVDDKERSWLYWQEFKGEYIEGTGFEAAYDDCPMWAAWLIPVHGKNWGRSYCEEYRGDLFSAEACESALNDIGALAAFTLPFVKPGSMTSINQIKKARNLEWLSGSATDLSVFRSEKGPDANFLLTRLERIERRLGAAFLMETAVMRAGERVTKEEVVRVGNQLDRAMGGIYSSLSQGVQRVLITRAFKLHEDEDKSLPPVPEGVNISVITGIDAMGRSAEEVALTELAAEINQAFGPGAAKEILDPHNYAARLTAAKGIKPDGLVKGAEQAQAEQASEKQQAMQQSLLDNTAGPMAGALAGAMAKGVSQSQQQQQPQEPQQ